MVLEYEPNDRHYSFVFTGGPHTLTNYYGCRTDITAD